MSDDRWDEFRVSAQIERRLVSQIAVRFVFRRPIRRRFPNAASLGGNLFIWKEGEGETAAIFSLSEEIVLLLSPSLLLSLTASHLYWDQV